MRLYFVLISFFVPLILNSQKLKTSHWFIGRNTEIHFINDSFKINKSTIFDSEEASSSISDINGNLELFSDGEKIWDSSNNVILNGNGLFGNNSSGKGVALISFNSVYKVYYCIYTSATFSSSSNLYFSKIIKNNDDKYEVVEKNILLATNLIEPIGVINSSNENEKWIIVKGIRNNFFLSFKFNKNYVVKCPVITKIGDITNSNFNPHSIAISSHGKFVAATNQKTGFVELYRFNNINGKLFDSINITGLNFPITGLAFSPNNKLLYLSERDNLIKKISLTNYKKDSLTQSIKSIQISCCPNVNSNFDLLQTINNKIAILFDDNVNSYLTYINNPDESNNYFDTSFLKIKLGYNVSAFTLPNFNQSYFYTPSINYSYEMDCIKNSIQFEGYDTFSAITHQWQTKKLYSVNNYTSIGNTKNTTHQFEDTGTYIVRYIADNGNRKDTVEKTITIYPKIKKDFLGKDTTIAQGSLFNIQLKSPQPSHCQEWYFERLNTQINKGSTNNIVADSIGKYICKTINQAFCEVTDTLIINECINNLNMPSIYRNLTDTLFTYQPLADSFVWYKNNQQITITKQPFIKLKDTGTYRVEAAKKGHCNRSSNTFYINKLGVKHYTLNDFNIKVYPNPSTGIINIESENQYKLKITDLIGRTILETENQKQLELVKGVYYLRFEVDGYVLTEKVIVL